MDTGGAMVMDTGGAMVMDTGGMMMGTGGMMMETGGMMMGTGGAPGGTCHSAGTLQVSNNGRMAYVIDGADNPSLTFCRGSTYVFAVNATGHPFYINTVQGTGTGNADTDGVIGNGATMGDVTFVVPTNAPNMLYYNCSLHAAMTGVIHVIN